MLRRGASGFMILRNVKNLQLHPDETFDKSYQIRREMKGYKYKRARTERDDLYPLGLPCVQPSSQFEIRTKLP
jgi:hypothetical protein